MQAKELKAFIQFPRDDGSGRTPRKTQNTAIDWVEENWSGPETLAMQLPTGVGKSWIARVIQRETRAAIIVPSNILMDDTYTKAYPDVNFLKGKTHYQCTELPGFTCQDAKALKKKDACPACPYNRSRQSAVYGDPTFFNPMSLFYLQKDKRYQRPDVIIVDEAHQLKSMLMMLAGKQFRKGKYAFPDTTSEFEITQWMQKQLEILHRLFTKALDDQDAEAIADLSGEIDNVSAVLRGLEENPQNYCIYISEGTYRRKTEKYLNVVPLEPPKFLVQSLLDCKKLVLLSATLPKTDVESLLQGKPYKYLDLPSPIDKSRRTIKYRPSKFAMNFKTDPAALAAHIEGVIAEFPGVNTIVHVSYGWAKKLAPHFKIPIITHTAENKNQALDTFKASGGVFLASGFAEGIDLKGDLCRLNIIPMVIKMNPYDPAVKKRMAWVDGQRWYDVEALKTLVQQAGRSTRGEDDNSTIVICDPCFPSLVIKRKGDVPISFTESIDWRGRAK